MRGNVMNQEAVIIIKSRKERRLKYIVRQFCQKESGKDVMLSINLHRIERGVYALNFSQLPPQVLFCDLVYKLGAKPNDFQEVRAYYKKGMNGGLPGSSVLFVDEKSNLMAVDSKGKLYEEDAERDPYWFKPKEETMAYIPFEYSRFPKYSRIAIFFVTEQKSSLLQQTLCKLSKITEWIELLWEGCLSVLVWLLLVGFALSLSLRTDSSSFVSRITEIWFAVFVIYLLFGKKSKKYVQVLFSVIVGVYVLYYVPNYYFSSSKEEKKAVIQEVYQTSGRKGHLRTHALLRFENNETFVLSYGVNKDVIKEGDTCVVDIRNGLWGTKVCRGIKCNGEWVWKH